MSDTSKDLKYFVHKHVLTTATQQYSGLMSAVDKTKLDNLVDRTAEVKQGTNIKVVESGDLTKSYTVSVVDSPTFSGTVTAKNNELYIYTSSANHAQSLTFKNFDVERTEVPGQDEKGNDIHKNTYLTFTDKTGLTLGNIIENKDQNGNNNFIFRLFNPSTTTATVNDYADFYISYLKDGTKIMASSFVLDSVRSKDISISDYSTSDIITNAKSVYDYVINNTVTSLKQGSVTNTGNITIGTNLSLSSNTLSVVSNPTFSTITGNGNSGKDTLNLTAAGEIIATATNLSVKPNVTTNVGKLKLYGNTSSIGNLMFYDNSNNTAIISGASNTTTRTLVLSINKFGSITSDPKFTISATSTDKEAYITTTNAILKDVTCNGISIKDNPTVKNLVNAKNVYDYVTNNCVTSFGGSTGVITVTTGNGLTYTNKTLSMAVGSTSTFGSVKVTSGNGLSISSGVISMAKASTTQIGATQLGVTGGAATYDHSHTALVPVGTIIANNTKATTLDGYVKCDGSTVTRADGYGALIDFLTGTTGAASATVPDLKGRVLQCIDTNQTAGSSVSAGLPNLVGTIPYIMGSGYDGKLFSNTTTTDTNCTDVQTVFTSTKIQFNASKYNSIYGKSTTVQPPAYTVNYWIKY